jgi:hypothetical protein
MNGVSRDATQNKPGCMTQVRGSQLVVAMKGTASEVFYDAYGKWVDLASNLFSQADANTDGLFGWLMLNKDYTILANDIFGVNIAFDAVYEIPLDATVTKANLLSYLGDVCDLVVSTYQYADNNAANDDLVQIVGFNYYGAASLKQTVLTRINPNECYQVNITD